MRFPLHSYASYLIWNDLGGYSSKIIIPLGLYGAQLALNWAWTRLFFRARNLKMVMYPAIHSSAGGLFAGVPATRVLGLFGGFLTSIMQL